MSAFIQPSDLLTPEQVCERLQVTKSWLYAQVRRRGGTIPYIRLGHFLRFHWTDLSAWLLANSRPKSK